jgi:hypothetical protein
MCRCIGFWRDTRKLLEDPMEVKRALSCRLRERSQAGYFFSRFDNPASLFNDLRVLVREGKFIGSTAFTCPKAGVLGIGTCAKEQYILPKRQTSPARRAAVDASSSHGIEKFAVASRIASTYRCPSIVNDIYVVHHNWSISDCETTEQSKACG